MRGPFRERERAWKLGAAWGRARRDAYPALWSGLAIRDARGLSGGGDEQRGVGSCVRVVGAREVREVFLGVSRTALKDALKKYASLKKCGRIPVVHITLASTLNRR